MPIRFTCPKCGAKLSVEDEYGGSQGKCKGCGETVVAPSLFPPGEERGMADSTDAGEPSDQVSSQARGSSEEPDRSEELEGEESPDREVPDMPPGRPRWQRLLLAAGAVLVLVVGAVAVTEIITGGLGRGVFSRRMVKTAPAHKLFAEGMAVLEHAALTMPPEQQEASTEEKASAEQPTPEQEEDPEVANARRAAVAVVAEMPGRPEAQRILRQLARRGSPALSDEAVLAICRSGDAATLSALIEAPELRNVYLSEKEQERVFDRFSSTTHGELAPILARGLSRKEAGLRGLFLNGLEKVGGPKQAEAVAKLLSGPDLHQWAVSPACDCLAAIGTPAQSGAVLAALSSADDVRKPHLCRALGAVGNKAMSSRLAPLLDGDSQALRRAAAAALAKWGDRRAIPVLQAALRDKSAESTDRAKAAEALAEYGDPDLFPVGDEVPEGNRNAVVEALFEIGTPAAVTRATESFGVSCHSAVCRLLREHKQTAVLDRLAANKDDDAARSAAKALAELDKKRARPVWLKLLTRSNPEMRMLAARGLGAAATAAELEAIDEALLRPENLVRTDSGEWSLGGFGRGSNTFLFTTIYECIFRVLLKARERAGGKGTPEGMAGMVRTALDSQDPEVLRGSALAAAELQLKDAVPKLSGLLDHEESGVRAAAALGLCQLATEEQLKPVTSLAETETDDDVLQALVMGMRERKTPAAARCLGKLADADDTDVRHAAANALTKWETGEETVVEVLVVLLANGKHPSARRQAAAGLSRRPLTTKTRTALEEALHDEDETVRAFAALSLGALQSKESISSLLAARGEAVVRPLFADMGVEEPDELVEEKSGNGKAGSTGAEDQKAKSPHFIARWFFTTDHKSLGFQTTTYYSSVEWSKKPLRGSEFQGLGCRLGESKPPLERQVGAIDAAVLALANMDDPRAMSALQEIVQEAAKRHEAEKERRDPGKGNEEEPVPSSNAAVEAELRAAIWALAWIGSREAIDTLMQLVPEPSGDDVVRALTAVASPAAIGALRKVARGRSPRLAVTAASALIEIAAPRGALDLPAKPDEREESEPKHVEPVLLDVPIE